MRALSDPAETRCGHRLPAPGRPGGSVRLARGAVPQARLARGPAGARPGGAGPRGRATCGAPGVRSSWPAEACFTPRPPKPCARSRRRPASPWRETQAGKGSLSYDHPQAVGRSARPGPPPPTRWPPSADVVVGIGTRWGDFTTASRTAFARPASALSTEHHPFDAAKHAGVRSWETPGPCSSTAGPLAGWSVDPPTRESPGPGRGMGRHGPSAPTSSATGPCPPSQR